MNVAEEYPARTDGNGVTWYRPRRAAGTSMPQWGWTALRERAHDDYALADVVALPGGGVGITPLAQVGEPIGDFDSTFVDLGFIDR